jgi:hypothetical protein
MRIKPALFAIVLILLSLPAHFILAARQFPIGNLEDTLKKEAAEKALSGLLNEQLPLKLDAKTAYPSVKTLPGGPFQPRALQLTAADMDTPLAPGDYTLPVTAFCTEYSVHRPGRGIAYEIAPMQGKAAPAISALLWRGTIQFRRNPQELQAVAWGIQSGLRYAQMPRSYQTVVNLVIPDYINEFSGDFVQNAEDTYSALAKGAHLPALNQLLAGMGKPGELMLSAQRQRDALLRQNTTDELRTQTLFAGQDSGVTTPEKAQDGPWTERIPGVAYMRYTIIGGNLATNNVMEIRIVSPTGAAARRSAEEQGAGARIVNAAYRSAATHATPLPQNTSPTMSGLFSGLIGYPVGAGAQDLVPVPVVSTSGPAIGTLKALQGTVQICKPDGTCKTAGTGDTVAMGDTVITATGGDVQILFADQTQMTISQNSKLKIDDYVYDPNNPATGRASYSVLQGAFVYLGGLIDKRDDNNVRMETAFGCLGIRGTQFIMRANGAEIDLIEGAVAAGANPAAPHTQFNAPAKIMRNAAGAQGSPLTQTQYDAIKQQLFPGTGPTVIIH